MNHVQSLILQIALVLTLIGGILTIVATSPAAPQGLSVATSTLPASAAATPTSTAQISVPLTSTPATSSPSVTSVKKPDSKPGNDVQTQPAEGPRQVHRIENPYATQPLAFETINNLARSSVVNIFCSSAAGSLRPISGSGVFINSKGFILTNAHVAQYVLLAESGKVNLDCYIRTGSPASVKWRAHVLYLPPAWINAHAADLNKEKPLGTGKYDFAILYPGESIDGTARPALFPSLLPDTREAIGFSGDPVLSASYPAELLGSISINSNLYQVTSVTTINELMTLGSGSVDVIAIGGVIGAQSGSSGGAIVNAWARLVGLITTTTEGATTGERTLRGITMSYVDSELRLLTGASLSEFLTKDAETLSRDFWTNTGPALVDTLITQISR